MSIWAIADIHASRHDPTTGAPSKPMDVFGAEWRDHVGRLERAWVELVAPDDTVIIAGDIDWALHLEEARETLERIDSWPGRKILIRGNHDYWWSSKTTSRVRRALPPSLSALHNNAFEADGFNICGAKGSPVPGGMDWTERDAKLLNRETERLQLSLGARDRSKPTIVALHYPPFFPRAGSSPIRALVEAEGVDCVVFGHLHGDASGSAAEGCWNGIEYRLVAGDAVGFRPVRIAREGMLESVRTTPGAASTPDVQAESIKYRGAGRMDKPETSLEELHDLAEDEISERRSEMGSEDEARELLDVPSQSPQTLAREQDEQR